MDFSYFLNYIDFVVFGNELWRILIFIFSLFLVYPIANTINYIVNNFLKKWASKSSIKFDDILINSLNPSVNLFVLAGLFYLGSSFLNKGSMDAIFLKIFNFLIIIPIVFFLIKFSTEMIAHYLKGEKKRTKINEAAIDLLMQITRIALFLIGILLILGNLGYDVSALLAGLGVGGLAFALAAQDILKNFFAGVSMIFDKTFNKGERVNFETHSGFIEELKLRSTKLRTYDGTLLTIPNSMLAENIVENVTKVPKVKVKQTFGLIYSTTSKQIEEAKKIIEDVILKDADTSKEGYTVWFDNFGAYSLDLNLIYFGELTMNDWPERVYMKDRVNSEILRRFEKAGLEFAYPTQTIELKK